MLAERRGLETKYLHIPFSESVWVFGRGELSEFLQSAELWDMVVTQDFRPNYREEFPGCWLKRAGITGGSRGGG